jgi:hypothetical protein
VQRRRAPPPKKSRKNAGPKSRQRVKTGEQKAVGPP